MLFTTPIIDEFDPAAAGAVGGHSEEPHAIGDDRGGRAVHRGVPARVVGNLELGELSSCQVGEHFGGVLSTPEELSFGQRGIVERFDVTADFGQVYPIDGAVLHQLGAGHHMRQRRSA